MSKKKIVESVDIDCMKDIIKRYGNVISKGIEVFNQRKSLKTLSISPSLDLSLNGGLLEGSLTIWSGPPKCGKTSSVVQVCSNAQQEGRKVVYVDGECRLKDYNLVGTKGLDLEKVYIIQSPDDGDQLSAEDFLNILEMVIKSPEYVGCVAVIDSTSSLVPRSELDVEASGTIRASLPKLLAHWLKKNAQVIKKQKIILQIITHYVTNTSGWGKKMLADSGLYLQYQADTMIDYESVKPWEEGGNKIGQIVEWDILCSSKGASGKRCTSYIRYGVGIDKVQEIIVLGTELGLIDKSGAWYYCSFLEGEIETYVMEEHRTQGVAKLYEYLTSKPEYYSILERKVKEILA